MGTDRHQTEWAGSWWKRDRNYEWHLESPAVLADLASILRRNPPTKLPAGPRSLSNQLREDDGLARRVWAHPMYVDLIVWVRRHYPDHPDAWDEMAVYALSRASALKAGQCSPTQVRAGMVNTARWNERRGRQGERMDELDRAGNPDDLIDEPLVPDAAKPCASDSPAGPLEYLTTVLGANPPDTARELLEDAWDVAKHHYVTLARITGMHGEALIAAAQSRNDVNRARRLSRQLPRDWPAAIRKAMVHLFAGTPRDPGLLLLWATTDPKDVPAVLHRRWRGLVAVLDPQVGRLPEPDRRRLRDQARRWTPCAPTPTEVAV